MFRVSRVGAVLGLALVLVLGGAVAIVLAASRHRQRRGRPSSTIQVASINCRSPSLGGELPALVYLPPGYTATGRRYPVIYFLHGLPASPESYKNNSFVADAVQTAGRRAIVVAPQGARSANSDSEYLDWSATQDWPRAITTDLTHCVDHRYRTIEARSGRALIGLSAGGYGALNIGLRNLKTFGVVESWSGYVAATDPSGYHVLQFASAAAQAAAAVPDDDALRAELARYPSLLAFYCGSADDRFADTNEQFDRTLAGGDVAHIYRSYPGGHSAALWRGEAPAWLSMALTYLSTGRTVLEEHS